MEAALSYENNGIAQKHKKLENMVLIFAPLRCNVLVVATKKNKEFAEDSAGVLDFASVNVETTLNGYIC